MIQEIQVRGIRGRGVGALVVWLTVSSMGGCSLAPRQARVERDKLHALGAAYEPPIAERQLPELGSNPTWREVLHRAFLANGELEAAYFEWKAAFERIDMASAYPNTNLAMGYSYMFSSQNMKSFDRMTFSAGFDAMENLSFPAKVAKQGQIALDQARAAGERFRQAKFELQRQVLGAWARYAQLAEQARIQREAQSLAALSQEASTRRLRVGGSGSSQQELLKAQIAANVAGDEIQNVEAELVGMRSMLNGMLGRAPDAPLPPPQAIETRPLPADDATMIRAGTQFNPELASMAQQLQGRRNALELARMQWIPDINPSIAFTGGAAQVIGAMIVLPTTIAEIQGSIRESQAMVRAADAMLRQTEHDKAGAFIATLWALRNSERQAKVFEDQVLPAAHRVAESARQLYATGSAGFLDLIEAHRTLLDVQRTIVQAKAAREVRLAELEELAGIDFETLVRPDIEVKHAE
jgi:cobalt-zinc-cadmium efflux system outer membrane protein